MDDGAFLVAAFCCKQGMGSWAEVWGYSAIERDAFFYAQCKLKGLTIDWSTGEVHAPK